MKMLGVLFGTLGVLLFVFVFVLVHYGGVPLGRVAELFFQFGTPIGIFLAAGQLWWAQRGNADERFRNRSAQSLRLIDRYDDDIQPVIDRLSTFHDTDGTWRFGDIPFADVMKVHYYWSTLAYLTQRNMVDHVIIRDRFAHEVTAVTEDLLDVFLRLYRGETFRDDECVFDKFDDALGNPYATIFTLLHEWNPDRYAELEEKIRS
ncbi:MAG: hypothetical protein HY341_02040 [Candidatus Kerfeldbacteria bacterium]|nr:hypothetical protein [Candidatus Kerfeldbacteria bacterium]